MKALSRLNLVWLAALVVIGVSLAVGAQPSAAEGVMFVGLGGMIITPANLSALQQGFNAAFLQGFGSVAPSWMQVAMRVPSTAKVENYGWMKELPGMREWIGQRVVNNLESAGAQLVNKDWEHTIGVKRTEIEDDNLGIYAPMFNMQGEIVGRHPDELVWGMLPQGFSKIGFDGQYYFDTDHVGYTSAGAETSWSNVQAGGGAPWFVMDLSRAFMKPLIFQERKKPQFVALNRADDTNVFMEGKYLFGADARYVGGFGFHQLAIGCKTTLDATNFAAARLSLETQRRPDGSPLPVQATHLVCGAANRAAAEALLLKEYLAGGESNTNYKTIQLIVSPWL